MKDRSDPENFMKRLAVISRNGRNADVAEAGNDVSRSFAKNE